MISEDHEDIDDPTSLDLGLELTEEEIFDAMGDDDDMDIDEEVSVIEADGEKDQGSTLLENPESTNENSNENSKDDKGAEFNSDDNEIIEVTDEQKQENCDQANRDETEIRPVPLATTSPVDEILKKVYGIVKPICESVDISCEWKRSSTDHSGFIKVFNPKTDEYSPFFPLLHLIIYDSDGSLFIKLFYQQCKVFKKSEVKDALSRLNKSEEYIAIVTILASFISELSLNKYQPCQGTFDQNTIKDVKNMPRNNPFQNLLAEKQGNRMVYRTMNCNLLAERGNTKCSQCSEIYSVLFGQTHSLYSAQIMEVMKNSRMERMTFYEIVQMMQTKDHTHMKIPLLIQRALMRDEAFKKSKHEGVTYWEINSAVDSQSENKTKGQEKIINDEQNPNSAPKAKDNNIIYKSIQKKRTLSEKSKTNPSENKAIEKIILRHPLPSLQKTHLVKKGVEGTVLVQGQHIQRPIQANLLSRVVMKKDLVLKNNPTQSTENIPFQTSSQQASFNTGNISGPTVRPVLNLNSIFERGNSKPKVIGREVFPNTVLTLQPSSQNPLQENEQQNKITRLEKASFNQARIVSTRTGNVVKYW